MTDDPACHRQSWRATLIVVISIPLSILSSIIFLSFLGETLNIMTLGGLALAVECWLMMQLSRSRTRIAI